MAYNIMPLAAATQFLRPKLRRWRSLLAVALLAGLFASWTWLLFGAALILAAELLHSWAKKRQAYKDAQRQLAEVGELAANPSGLTYARFGKSTSIAWDEVVSVAYSQDPISQENQWLLRYPRGDSRRMSIPDYPQIRAQLLSCLESHLPGFSSKVYDDVVVETFSQDNDAVVECWARMAPPLHNPSEHRGR